MTSRAGDAGISPTLVYSGLTALFAHRGWTRDAEHSCLVADRHRFRAFAHSPTVRAVALFVDMRTADRSKDELSSPPLAMAPSAGALEAAVRLADAESAALYDKETPLVVLALRFDSAPRLRADAQAFVDAIDLDRRRAAFVYVEHWHTRQLAIDVLAHADVSPHRIASADERRLRTPVVEQLPLLRLCDPVARWLGAREGDVVVEERDDDDCGRSLYFRRVVAYGGDA